MYAARHALAIVVLLFGQRVRRCALEGGFGEALLDRCSAGGNTTVKELDARRVRCPAQRLWTVGVVYDLCLFYF